MVVFSAPCDKKEKKGGLAMQTKTITFTAPCVTEILDTQLEAPEEYKVQVKLATSTISSGNSHGNPLWNDPFSPMLRKITKIGRLKPADSFCSKNKASYPW